MTTAWRRRVPALLVLMALLVVPSSPAGSAGPMVRTADPVYAGGAVDRFSPKGGVNFNNPVGKRPQKRALMTRIQRAIDATPRWATIRIMSWNILSDESVDKLIAAHQRGVRVRVLMADSNRFRQPNPGWVRLRQALAQNTGRLGNRYSRAQTCNQSCRGNRGAAHAKFFMFSRAGSSAMVVMHTSANLTDAATYTQWNEMQTFTGGRAVWDFFDMIHRQMEEDRTQTPLWRSVRVGRQTLAFSPLGTKVDPYLALANTVRCRGAENTSTGRTVIRYFPDVIRGERGLRLATRLKQLWNQGCDVRIGWTVLGAQVRDVLRSRSGRGPVPMRHMAVHTDDDGAFDLYAHMKTMTVRGVIGDSSASYRVINGSSNVSDDATISDENIGMNSSEWITRRYESWLDNVYRNAPVGRRLDLSQARYEGVDPYANMELD